MLLHALLSLSHVLSLPLLHTLHSSQTGAIPCHFLPLPLSSDSPLNGANAEYYVAERLDFVVFLLRTAVNLLVSSLILLRLVLKLH